MSSLDIENILLKAAGVAEAAAIGVPDPKGTERPLGIVALTDDATLTNGDLKAHRQHYAGMGMISRDAIPDRFVFVVALPKTSVGKIDRKLLRTRYVSLSQE